MTTGAALESDVLHDEDAHSVQTMVGTVRALHLIRLARTDNSLITLHSSSSPALCAGGVLHLSFTIRLLPVQARCPRFGHTACTVRRERHGSAVALPALQFVHKRTLSSLKVFHTRQSDERNMTGIRCCSARLNVVHVSRSGYRRFALSSRENLSRTALYLQIFDILVERISSGEWRPGRSLPNEFDLAREFGVSAGTIRKALDKLEADRVIKRQHGKGSFVLDQNSEELAFRFSKIVDHNGKRAGDSQSTLLAQEIGEATPVERQCLALKGGGEIVRTRRLRHHHGRATRYETTCLAMSRLGITTLQQVGDYLIVPFAQQQGVHLARASEKLTVSKRLMR